VHELLAQAYDALGQKDRAVGARRAIQSATLKLMPPPDDALNDRLIAVCYSSTRLLKQAGLESRQGRPERAIQVARRAAEANPSDADIRNFLARTLLTYYGNKPESVEQALTELGECLRLKPDDPVPLYGFSSDFFENPQPPASVARIDALLRPYANRTDAHFYLGLVADAEGRTDEAVAQYQAALKENPKQSGVYNKLGVMENKAGRFEAAMAYFQRSIQVDPMNAAARLNLGVSLLQRGRDAQGLKELHEVLRLKPNDSAAHFCIAFSHLYAKKPAEAIPEFQEGLRFKPDDPEGHFGLASALFLVRQRDEAAKELREALRLRPGYPEAQQLLQTLER
jgi:tetratricopeptide (TPR) repeat protein